MSMTRRSFMSSAAAVAAVPAVFGQAKRVYKFAVVAQIEAEDEEDEYEEDWNEDWDDDDE